MNKAKIQGIINVIFLISYLVFVFLYARFGNVKIAKQVYITSYMLLLSIVLFSKYLIYKRRSMLYFVILSILYLMVFIKYFYAISILQNRDFGLFLLLPGILSLIFWKIWGGSVNLRFGIFASLIGGLLFLIFNIFIG